MPSRNATARATVSTLASVGVNVGALRRESHPNRLDPEADAQQGEIQGEDHIAHVSAFDHPRPESGRDRSAPRDKRRPLPLPRPLVAGTFVRAATQPLLHGR